MFICAFTHKVHTKQVSLFPFGAATLCCHYEKVFIILSSLSWAQACPGTYKFLKWWNHCSSCVSFQALDAVGLCCSHSMNKYLNFNLRLELQMPCPLFLGSSIVFIAFTTPQAGLRAGLLTSFAGRLGWGFIKTKFWDLLHLFCTFFAQSNSAVLQALQS